MKHHVVVPKISMQNTKLQTVSKTAQLLDQLKSIAKEGFSPSSLGQYIRNPIDFYNYKILGLKQPNDLEETIEANTFGGVVHFTLKKFYAPFVGHKLEVSKLEALKPKIQNTVSDFFQELYKKGDFTHGKNFISFEIAKRYVHNFLNKEIQFLNEGNEIKLMSVEKTVEFDFEHPEFDFPIKLKGNVDRIDICNGTRRIIDYKTSKVSQADMNLVDWGHIIKDYKKHNKSFQVLMYAYIKNQQEPFDGPTIAGIYSFKNLKAGILNFTKKDKPGSGALKQQHITPELLKAFENELIGLLHELFDPNILFTEKEV